MNPFQTAFETFAPVLAEQFVGHFTRQVNRLIEKYEGKMLGLGNSHTDDGAAYRNARAFFKFESSSISARAVGVNEEWLKKSADIYAQHTIEAFVAKRAEWQIMRREADPVDVLRDCCGEDGERDARLAFWEDATLRERFHAFTRALGQGTTPQKTKASAIEQHVTDGSSTADFDALYGICFTKSGTPNSVKANNELKKNLGPDAAQAVVDEWLALCDKLVEYRDRAHDLQVRRLNEAMFLIGEACIHHYQKLKDDRRKLDFADLEMHAWHLLTDGDSAAYLHSRIDARYRHVLIDEFQDTNPLQWHIVRAWLDAYGEDGDRTSVFIVGDPKQSIYRFRRADPRVFNAARAKLCAQGAADLSTRQTRRNGRAIVDVLNRAMDKVNGLYQPQDTLSDDEDSVVWRLPLVRPDDDSAAGSAAGDSDGTDDSAADASARRSGDSADEGAQAAGADDAIAGGAGQADGKGQAPWALRDPLKEDPPEDEDSRREREARLVGAALWAARERWQQVKPGKEPLKWSDMMILVRSRTHLRAYEAGLRAVHIPFTSSRAGGLLDTLEASDLLALLRWLSMPADDLAFAQLLKSPIAACCDDDLIALAARNGEGNWWQRAQRRLVETMRTADGSGSGKGLAVAHIRGPPR